MVILGLDYGDRYIGVALTDPDGEFTYRFSTIDQTKDDVLEEIEKIIEGESIKKIVVGMPKGLASNETDQTKKTRNFVTVLKDGLSKRVDIVEEDETFSSVEASRIIAAEGGRQEEEHAEAARLVLETFIKKQVE